MMTCDDPCLLFVYGTLRRDSGHAMGAWLAAQADWLGPAWCEGARLYRVGWYPALAPGPAGECVRGDLYRLRDVALLWPRLDAFEGVTGSRDDEYRRVRSPVRCADGVVVAAWVYWHARDGAGLEWLPGGDWLAAGDRT